MRLGSRERGSRRDGQAVPYADCAMPGTVNWQFSDAIAFKLPEVKAMILIQNVRRNGRLARLIMVGPPGQSPKVLTQKQPVGG